MVRSMTFDADGERPQKVPALTILSVIFVLLCAWGMRDARVAASARAAKLQAKLQRDLARAAQLDAGEPLASAG